MLQEFVIKNLAAGKKMIKAGKAELKIMITFVYYIIMGVISHVSYFANTQDDIQLLILCESTGNRECNVDLSAYNRSRILNIVAFVMVTLLPVVAILFNFDPKACTRKRSRRNV